MHAVTAAGIDGDRRYVRGRRCPICGGADNDPRGAAHCSCEEIEAHEARRATGETATAAIGDDIEQLAAERAAKLRSARSKGGSR
jgi:hypothetical protein